MCRRRVNTDPGMAGEFECLRFAERDSTYDQRFAEVNSMRW